MSKNRVIYNSIGVFSSNAPSSGYHFLSLDGAFTNNTDPTTSFNLVFPINRVFHADYGFSIPRTDVKGLGSIGTLARPILSYPNINLNISYYQMGLINEARMGFVFNRPTGESSNGAPIYGNNGKVIPISGYLDRNYQIGIESSLGYPLTTREPRNLWIATRQDNLDLNETQENPAYKSNNVDCYAFGDCYLTNYRASCSVGSLPQCSVSFLCNNIVYYNGASGKNIPSVNPKDYSLIDGKYFNLPNNFQGTGLPTVLLPKDISISITHSDNTPLVNLPVSFSDIKIQGYDINMELNREPLTNLGYKLPIDYRINLPVFVNLSFNTIVGDNQTGALHTFVDKDKDYDIKIKLNYNTNPRYNGTAVLYEFLGARLNNLSLDDTIGSNRTCNFAFITEINPLKLNKGFFISGQLGIPNTGIAAEALLGDDFFGLGIIDNLITEDGNPILIASQGGRIIY